MLNNKKQKKKQINPKQNLVSIKKEVRQDVTEIYCKKNNDRKN